jgi:SAM-dependent methyltransferase
VRRRPASIAGLGSPSNESLPLPPLEMRRLIGPTENEAFDNPTRGLVYPYLDEAHYESIFDFGCGCGRVARQLILQNPQPGRYFGIDLHRGMIEWCRANLAPHAPNFTFEHHDVFAASLNPREDAPRTRPFPVESGAFTLINAWSVFTHLTETQVPHYLNESARILTKDGLLNSTWFLFDKREFPMMQDYANALYINEFDLSAAVIFDRSWLRKAAGEAGLTIIGVYPPIVRGFQWTLLLTPTRLGLQEAELPVDDAPYGQMKPPSMPPNASAIGLDPN